ncbi:hypothetical protein T492DRAFT_1008223, partial [Pavlovales sp. CCMP2436]
MKRDLQTKERALLAWLEALMADAPSHLSMRHDQVISGGAARSARFLYRRALTCGHSRVRREQAHAGATRVPATARLAHIRLVRRTTGRLPPLQPDRFVDKQDAVHPSCFALKHGVLTLARETAWLKRLGLVEARLRYHRCPVPDAQHLVNEFLFYGDDSRACESSID